MNADTHIAGDTLSVTATIEAALETVPSGLSVNLLKRRLALGRSLRPHHVVLGLSALVDSGRVVLRNGSFWAIMNTPVPCDTNDEFINKALAAATTHPPIIGDPTMIGPVWEPAFAQRLWNRGVRIIQQYPTAGFYLDIALVSPDRSVKLNVEVDGRMSHCDHFGRRRMRDVIRDARLEASGWTVKRFWVNELRADMDACAAQVDRLWTELNTQKEHR